MKYTNYALVLSVLSVVLIAGCVGQGSAPKECGTNQTCFAEAANTCSPARGTISSDEFTMAQEIKGKTSADKCGLYVKMEKPFAAEANCNVPLQLSAEDEANPLNVFCNYCTGSLVDTLRSAGAC